MPIFQRPTHVDRLHGVLLEILDWTGVATADGGVVEVGFDEGVFSGPVIDFHRRYQALCNIEVDPCLL